MTDQSGAFPETLREAELREVAQRLRGMDLCGAHTPRSHFVTLGRAASLLEDAALALERIVLPRDSTMIGTEASLRECAQDLLRETPGTIGERVAIERLQFALSSEIVCSRCDGMIKREKVKE